jgi:hypothetical protein
MSDEALALYFIAFLLGILVVLVLFSLIEGC